MSGLYDIFCHGQSRDDWDEETQKVDGARLFLRSLVSTTISRLYRACVTLQVFCTAERHCDSNGTSSSQSKARHPSRIEVESDLHRYPQNAVPSPEHHGPAYYLLFSRG